jgi:hypothetical protein
MYEVFNDKGASTKWDPLETNHGSRDIIFARYRGAWNPTTFNSLDWQRAATVVAEALDLDMTTRMAVVISWEDLEDSCCGAWAGGPRNCSLRVSSRHKTTEERIAVPSADAEEAQAR